MSLCRVASARDFLEVSSSSFLTAQPATPEEFSSAVFSRSMGRDFGAAAAD